MTHSTNVDVYVPCKTFETKGKHVSVSTQITENTYKLGDYRLNQVNFTIIDYVIQIEKAPTHLENYIVYPPT